MNASCLFNFLMRDYRTSVISSRVTRSLLSWLLLFLSLFVFHACVVRLYGSHRDDGHSEKSAYLEGQTGEYFGLGAYAVKQGSKKDFYKILGVSKNASQHDISKAYRALAKKMHPDVNPSKKSSEEFVEVARAYEVLSNPEKRQKYDLGDTGDAWGPGMQTGDGDFMDIFSDLVHGMGGLHNMGGRGGFFKVNMGSGGSDGMPHFQVFNDNSDEDANLYDKVDVVTELTPNNFRAEVEERETTYLVKVYNPLCQPCRDFKPEYGTTADILKGLVPSGAINCKLRPSMHLCRISKSYPTVYFYGVNKKEPPIPYKGKRRYEAIIDFISEKLPNYFVALRLNNIETWLSTKPNSPKLILFANEKPLRPLFLLAANSYHSQICFGVIQKDNHKIIEKYFTEPTEFNMQTATVYIEFPSMLKIDDIDTLKGEWQRLKGITNDAFLFYIARVAAKARVPAVNLYHPLTTRRMRSGECVSTDGQFCFILILPSRNSARGLAEEANTAMNKFSEKFARDPVKFLWIDAQAYPGFVSHFGYEKEEREWLVAYRPKRKKYEVMVGPLHAGSMEDFINNVISGATLSKTIKNVPVSLDYRSRTLYDEL